MEKYSTINSTKEQKPRYPLGPQGKNEKITVIKVTCIYGSMKETKLLKKPLRLTPRIAAQGRNKYSN